MTTPPDETAYCPVPNTHDKLQEAHWYLHQMQEHYHEPDLFRYSCNAFLQASRSVTFMLQSELGNIAPAKEWYSSQQQLMRDDVDLRLLNDLRVQVVHKEPLLLASNARITHLKNGRDKLSLGIPVPTSMRSLDALIRNRNLPIITPHPQRAFSGEEVGVIRRWSTPPLAERELVEWAIECWTKLAAVVDRAHHFHGLTDHVTTVCSHLSADYMVLCESSVFPEVTSLWRATPPPMMVVAPKAKELPLWSQPGSDSTELYRLRSAHADVAVGWIGPLRPEGTKSMLLVAVANMRITKDSAVYFDPEAALERYATVEESAQAYSDDVAFDESSD